MEIKVGFAPAFRRHCEPTGRRKAPPDDKLRDLSAVARRAKAEAIQLSARGAMDCFVASAPLRKRFAFVAGNDGVRDMMTSDHLFVYGTLMRGFDHPMAQLLSAHADFLGEARRRHQRSMDLHLQLARHPPPAHRLGPVHERMGMLVGRRRSTPSPALRGGGLGWGLSPR
jgi:hypothetical protein